MDEPATSTGPVSSTSGGPGPASWLITIAVGGAILAVKLTVASAFSP